jgi:hypothetical protein
MRGGRVRPLGNRTSRAEIENSGRSRPGAARLKPKRRPESFGPKKKSTGKICRAALFLAARKALRRETINRRPRMRLRLRSRCFGEPRRPARAFFGCITPRNILALKFS